VRRAARARRRAVELGATLALGAVVVGASLGGCVSATYPFADECKTADDCTAPLVCVDNLCVDPASVGTGSLLSGTCTRIYGVSEAEALSPDTLLIGTLFPATGDLASLGPSMNDAVQLAVDEINQVGGLPGGVKLGVVACDTGTDEATAEAAAEHLATVVGAPVILGAGASSVTLDTFNAVARPRGVLMMSPSATSTALTNLDDDDLLWRTAPSDAGQAAAIGAWLVARGAKRVAVIHRDDTYGNGLQNALSAPDGPLCQAIDCLSDDAYFARSYNPDTLDAQLPGLMDELEGFIPDVTVVVAFRSDGLAIMNAMAVRGFTRVVLTDGWTGDDLATLLDSQEMVCSLVMTQPAAPASQFLLRYKSKYGTKPGAFAANAYDAAYLVGYGLAAAWDQPLLDGAAVAAGLRRLSAGEEVQVGPDAWGATVNVLRGDPAATVNFQGVSGPLDFDTHGEAPADTELWVVNADEHHSVSLGVVYTADGKFIDPRLDDPEWPGAGPTCEGLSQSGGVPR